MLYLVRSGDNEGNKLEPSQKDEIVRQANMGKILKYNEQNLAATSADRSVTANVLLRRKPDEEEDEEDGYDKPEADDEDDEEHEDENDDDGYSVWVKQLAKNQMGVVGENLSQQFFHSANHIFGSGWLNTHSCFGKFFLAIQQKRKNGRIVMLSKQFDQPSLLISRYGMTQYHQVSILSAGSGCLSLSHSGNHGVSGSP
jgi:hypothetical protein